MVALGRATAQLFAVVCFQYTIHITCAVRESRGVDDETFDEKKEDEQLLGAINYTQLEAILINYGEQFGFRQSLERALKRSEGTCPTKGMWENKGCAPVPPDFHIRCKCPQSRVCKHAIEMPGLEEELKLGYAMQLYAGSCEYSDWRWEKISLMLMLALTVTLGLRCVVQTHAGRGDEMSFTLEETEEQEKQEGEDGTTRRDSISGGTLVKYQHDRMQEFGSCIEKANDFPELVREVMHLSPGQTQKMRPISGNIYRYWAMGGKKKNWLIYFGFRFVLLIQLLVPMAICRWACYQYDWEHSEIKFVKYRFGDLEYGMSHVVGRLLSFLFTYCISLHALSITKKACMGNFSLFLLFVNLPEESIEVPKSTFLFLFLDAFMSCYLTMVSLIAMVLVFSLARSPKDICFDALGLLFILRLHEAQGDLDFISTQDFDSDRIGELCHYVLSPSCKELRKGREVEDRVPLRWTLLWSATELLIYLILMLVPVFQLFVVDGLVLRSTGLSVGVLGTHIADEEARLAILEGHGH